MSTISEIADRALKERLTREDESKKNVQARLQREEMLHGSQL